MSGSPTDYSAPREPQVGDYLGHYRLEQLLGAGGMGVVFKAYEEALNRHVAVKVLSHKLAADHEFVQRFLHEAQAVASLNHPNITQIYYIAQQEDILFFSMEFVEGSELETLLRTKHQLDVRQSIEYIRQAALGLQHAQKHGVIHRDVKPANLMVTREGVVKVADFGLAKEVKTDQSLTSTQTVMGTPYYMSPEQAKGDIVDHRSDIYSLGATLYQLLSGRPPFIGDSAMAIMIQHIQSPLLPIQQFNPAVPPPLNIIIHRAMAKHITVRYQTYAELIRDLDNFLAAPVAVPASTAVKPAEEPKRSFVSTLAMLALVIVLGWFLIENTKQKSREPSKLSPINNPDLKTNPPQPPRPADREAKAQKRFDEFQKRADTALDVGNLFDAFAVYAEWPEQFSETKAQASVEAKRQQIRELAQQKWLKVQKDAQEQRDHYKFDAIIALYDAYLKSPSRLAEFATEAEKQRALARQGKNDYTAKLIEEQQIALRAQEAKFQEIAAPIYEFIRTFQFEEAQKRTQGLPSISDATIQEKLTRLQTDIARLVVLKQNIAKRIKEKPTKDFSLATETAKVDGRLIAADANTLTLRKTFEGVEGFSDRTIRWAELTAASGTEIFRSYVDVESADDFLAYGVLLKYQGRFADARQVFQATITLDATKKPLVDSALAHLDELERHQHEQFAAQLLKRIKLGVEQNQFDAAQRDLQLLQDQYSDTDLVKVQSRAEIAELTERLRGEIDEAALMKERKRKFAVEELAVRQAKGTVVHVGTKPYDTLTSGIQQVSAQGRDLNLVVLDEGSYESISIPAVNEIRIVAAPGEAVRVKAITIASASTEVTLSRLCFVGGEVDRDISVRDQAISAAAIIGSVRQPAGKVHFVDCAFLSDGILIKRAKQVAIDNCLFATSRFDVFTTRDIGQFSLNHCTFVNSIAAREESDSLPSCITIWHLGDPTRAAYEIKNSLFSSTKLIFAHPLGFFNASGDKFQSDYNYFRETPPIISAPLFDEASARDFTSWHKTKNDLNSKISASPGFEKPEDNLFRVTDSSPCHKAATDKDESGAQKDLGVNWDGILWKTFQRTVQSIKKPTP